MDRLFALRSTPRHVDGGKSPSNFVGGLIDLVREVRPKTVLEIGSHTGVSTEVFLLHCDRVTAVDPWTGDDERFFPEFLKRVGGYSNVEIIRGASPDALSTFRDGEFDLCYIDGLHDYASVSADIDACKRVCRDLSGHDYYAVRRAVDERFSKIKVFSDGSWLVRK